MAAALCHTALNPVCMVAAQAQNPLTSDAGAGLRHGAVLRAWGGGVGAHRVGGHEPGSARKRAVRGRRGAWPQPGAAGGV